MRTHGSLDYSRTIYYRKIFILRNIIIVTLIIGPIYLTRLIFSFILCYARHVFMFWALMVPDYVRTEFFVNNEGFYQNVKQRTGDQIGVTSFLYILLNMLYLYACISVFDGLNNITSLKGLTCHCCIGRKVLNWEKTINNVKINKSLLDKQENVSIYTTWGSPS